MKDDNDNEGECGGGAESVWTRFASPVIDDPGLPLADVVVAQIIAPSAQIAWLSGQHAPQPTWLAPLFGHAAAGPFSTRQGSFVAPALIHGAALASCWIVGALAAKAYERQNIAPVQRRVPTEASKDVFGASDVVWDYGSVVTAVAKGGAFATGLLILASQADLYLEYGRWVQLGESDDVDFRLLVALAELINDVFFEAVTIAAWRLFLAYQAERMAKE